ncbi:MAG: 50S ribosomal protein L22 [Patescibacteria group bacterium]
MVTASLNDYRQAPRKVRLVANLVKGKKVGDAMTMLDFLVKEASGPMKKLIASAVANAKTNFNLSAENLFIKNVQVNGGTIMKRSMPRARGSAFPIHKHSSHVTLVLDVVAEKPKKVTKAAKTASAVKAAPKTNKDSK